MMLAELSGLEIGATICAITFGALTIILALVSIFKKQDMVLSPQPLIIAMQKEFATKHEFDAHLVSNKAEHDQLFHKLGGVERGARAITDAQVEVVRRDLVVVGNQVAGLQVETKLQSVQLNRMEKTISDMPGRIVADIVNSKKL